MHHVIPVTICALEERVGATMATVNSVISNTDASVFFYIVTLRDAVKLTRFITCYCEACQSSQGCFVRQLNKHLSSFEVKIRVEYLICHRVNVLYCFFQEVHREDKTERNPV